MKNRLIVAMALGALVLGGCSSNSNKSTSKATEPAKSAASSTTKPAGASSTAAPATAVSSNEPNVAELEKLARAAAEGKATAAAKPAVTLPASPHDRPGFATKTVDGRLWVFKAGAKEIAEFVSHGELAKSVTRIGVGPDGMSLRAPDAETIDAYLKAGQ